MPLSLRRGRVSAILESHEALVRLRDAAYDVVILDMKMPRKEGIEVLRDLQSFPEHPQVIVMTGFQDGIRDRIISANPHLLVFQSGTGGLADADTVAGRVKAIPGVRSATPFVLQQALFTSPGGEAHGGLIRGVDLGSAALRQVICAASSSGTS